MRLGDFSSIVFCVFSVALLTTETVQPQTHPLWLHGEAADVDPDIERLNRAFIRLGDKVRRAMVHIRVEPTKARGSGFIINPQGYILTAHHVVSDAKEIEIRLPNRQRLRGEIVATDVQVDLAVLKINGEGEFPVLALGDSDALMVGELVASLGYPFGLESSFHMGIVSRRGKRQNGSAAFDHIQVDSPVSSGESGGPLVNTKGHVVGMLTQASERGTIGFAVPINVIKTMIPRASWAGGENCLGLARRKIIRADAGSRRQPRCVACQGSTGQFCTGGSARGPSGSAFSRRYPVC